MKTVKRRNRKHKGYWDELIRCLDCPPDKFYPRRSIKNRAKRGLCPEHVALIDNKKTFRWPSCPGCKNEDWIPDFKWNGNAKKTTMTCSDCGWSDLAIKHLDAYYVWMYASPIIT